MDKRIIFGGIAAAFAAVITVVVAELPGSKDLQAGPATADKCVAQLVDHAQNRQIECDIVPTNVDNRGERPGWICNGFYPPNQDCLTSIAGTSQQILFHGRDCPEGACWDARLRVSP